MTQFDLPIGRRAAASDISDASIMKQDSFHGALTLCIRESGLEDKEVYLALGLDAAQFSRIIKGTMHFPPNLLLSLMDLCGNEIPLRWLALTRGYELRRLQSSLEEENEALRAALREKDHDLETILDFVRQTK